MKIPKLLKKEPNDRPLRPKTGVKRDHTVLHISWADFEEEEDCWGRRLRVDADHVEDFVKEFFEKVPKADRVWCPYIELWYVSEEHKDLVTELGNKHFDKVVKELRKWQT